jgi:hypothetical protein
MLMFYGRNRLRAECLTQRKLPKRLDYAVRRWVGKVPLELLSSGGFITDPSAEKVSLLPDTKGFGMPAAPLVVILLVVVIRVKVSPMTHVRILHSSSPRPMAVPEESPSSVDHHVDRLAHERADDKKKNVATSDGLPELNRDAPRWGADDHLPVRESLSKGFGQRSEVVF